MGAFCKPSRKKALRRAHLPEHRSELEKLRADPSLIPTAVEEIVRWVSPVIEFCRTADEDVEVAGTTIRAPTWRASSCRRSSAGSCHVSTRWSSRAPSSACARASSAGSSECRSATACAAELGSSRTLAGGYRTLDSPGTGERRGRTTAGNVWTHTVVGGSVAGRPVAAGWEEVPLVPGLVCPHPGPVERCGGDSWRWTLAGRDEQRHDAARRIPRREGDLVGACEINAATSHLVGGME